MGKKKKNGGRNKVTEEKRNLLLTFLEHPFTALPVGLVLGMLFASHYYAATLFITDAFLVLSFYRVGFVAGSRFWSHLLKVGPFLAVVGSAHYAILLLATPWPLEHSNPFSVIADFQRRKYVAGQRIAGIPWKDGYLNVGVTLSNTHEKFAIENLTLIVHVDHGLIYGVGNTDKISNCSYDVYTEDIQPHSWTLNRSDGTSEVWEGPILTPAYRIHCERIEAKNQIPLVLATDERPDKATISGSYDLLDEDKRVRKSLEIEIPVVVAPVS